MDAKELISNDFLIAVGFKRSHIQEKEFLNGDFILYRFKPVNTEVYFNGVKQKDIKFISQLKKLYKEKTGKELELLKQPA